MKEEKQDKTKKIKKKKENENWMSNFRNNLKLILCCNIFICYFGWNC